MAGRYGGALLEAAFFGSLFDSPASDLPDVIPDPSEVLAGVHYRYQGVDYVGTAMGVGGGFTEDDRETLTSVLARLSAMGSRPAVFIDTIGRGGEIAIRRGYARKAVYGNSIGPFVFAADLTDATIELRGVGPVEAFKPTKAFADGKWSVTFDLDDADAAALEVGTYGYVVAAIYPDGSEVDPVERQSGLATVF